MATVSFEQILAQTKPGIGQTDHVNNSITSLTHSLITAIINKYFSAIKKSVERRDTLTPQVLQLPIMRRELLAEEGTALVIAVAILPRAGKGITVHPLCVPFNLITLPVLLNAWSSSSITTAFARK